jgi:hypothetical protein
MIYLPQLSVFSSRPERRRKVFNPRSSQRKFKVFESQNHNFSILDAFNDESNMLSQETKKKKKSFFSSFSSSLMNLNPLSTLTLSRKKKRKKNKYQDEERSSHQLNFKLLEIKKESFIIFTYKERKISKEK